MIRTMCLASVAFALAACEPGASSRQPLLDSRPLPIREGLWAILADGCAEPRSANVGAWDSCAMPVWVGRDTVSYIALGRTTAKVGWADGEPALIQMTAPSDGWPSGAPPWLGGAIEKSADEPDYSYLIARGEGERPYARGRVWQAPCPRPKPADKPEEFCQVRSLPELRTLAAQAVSGSPGHRAVWVATAD